MKGLLAEPVIAEITHSRLVYQPLKFPYCVFFFVNLGTYGPEVALETLESTFAAFGEGSHRVVAGAAFLGGLR